MNSYFIHRCLIGVMGLSTMVLFDQQASSQSDSVFLSVRSFGFPNQTAAEPEAVIEGTDNVLYGITRWGGVTEQGSQAKGAVFRVQKDGEGFTILHSFMGGPDDGSQPTSLVEGSDGMLYGTTYYGGSTEDPVGSGTIYKIAKSGSDYTIIYRFTGINGDGANPQSPLVEDSNGVMYGTTRGGGSYGWGTIFTMQKAGDALRYLHSFRAVEGDGGSPTCLLEGSDAALYGATIYGGADEKFDGAGTVFMINKDGSGYEVKYSFTPTTADGTNPHGQLIEGSDGALFGVTQSGGSEDAGTVYRINRGEHEIVTLHEFSWLDGLGGLPLYGVVEGTNGALYGTTWAGGSDFAGLPGHGVVYKLQRNGTGFTVLHSFGLFGGDGALPNSFLVEGSGGTLYGVTRDGGFFGDGALFCLSEEGDSYNVVHHFSAMGGDGGAPKSSVLEGGDGALYGVTSMGGKYNAGTVFRINQNGSDYLLLHHFRGQEEGDGRSPAFSLAQDTNGLIYGVTSGGGAYNGGTVFRLHKDGIGYVILHSFDPLGNGGWTPASELIIPSDGRLYGAAWRGGDFNAGTLFSMNPDGSDYHILHQFESVESDGRNPRAALLEGSNGLLYGTTSQGGIRNRGTAFHIRKDGSEYEIIHHFGAVSGDGEGPNSAVIEAADGALYGTTSNGGFASKGSIFKINLDGSGYNSIHSFSGGTEGAIPTGALLDGGDGLLYGTTRSGGTNNEGVLFHIDREGNGFTVLHEFFGGAHVGVNSVSPLIKVSTEKAFYGTIAHGGRLGGGSIFRFGPANRPPVVKQPLLDVVGYVGLPFYYHIPAGVFADPDEGQTITVTVSNLPPGIVFEQDGRLIRGTPTSLGTHTTVIAATDNGLPPLSVSDEMLFSVSEWSGSVSLRLTPIVHGYRLRFLGIPGHSYEIQRSPNLCTWQTLFLVVAPGHGLIEYDDASPLLPTGFYRVASIP